MKHKTKTDQIGFPLEEDTNSASKRWESNKHRLLIQDCVVIFNAGWDNTKGSDSPISYQN